MQVCRVSVAAVRLPRCPSALLWEVPSGALVEGPGLGTALPHPGGLEGAQWSSGVAGLATSFLGTHPGWSPKPWLS